MDDETKASALLDMLASLAAERDRLAAENAVLKDLVSAHNTCVEAVCERLEAVLDGEDHGQGYLGNDRLDNLRRRILKLQDEAIASFLNPNWSPEIMLLPGGGIRIV